MATKYKLRTTGQFKKELKQCFLNPIAPILL